MMSSDPPPLTAFQTPLAYMKPCEKRGSMRSCVEGKLMSVTSLMRIVPSSFPAIVDPSLMNSVGKPNTLSGINKRQGYNYKVRLVEVVQPNTLSGIKKWKGHNYKVRFVEIGKPNALSGNNKRQDHNCKIRLVEVDARMILLYSSQIK